MVSQVIAARSRRQIREAVGYTVLGSKLIVSAATSNGTTTTIVDTGLRGGDDEYNGRWLIPRGGTDDGTIVRVTDYVASTNTLTIETVNSDSTVSGVAYEMWPDNFDPLRINSLIDQAFINATGRVFDPEQDISLHLQSNVWRYDIPTQFAMITSLQDRRRVDSLLLESCDAVWDTIDDDVTGSADTEIKRRGGASLKLVIAAAVSAGDDLATSSILAPDISSYDTIEFWVRATSTTAAAALNLVLSDSSGITEGLPFPAIATADTWQFVRLPILLPQDHTALTTIAIDLTVDGAYTLWIDEIRAVRSDSAEWHEIPRHQWGLDVQARDIVFAVQPSYRLLKIVGGDKPALMTTDSTTSEIDDAYVESYATSLLKADMAETQGERQFWLLRAEQTKAGLPPLRNVRKFTN